MQGVVAAGHPQTVEAATRMFQQGGNAVDAAVAAAFASFIVESALVNIGAGGIAQIYDVGTKQATVYDFFSTMPGLSADRPITSTPLDFREILVDFGSAQQPFYIGRGSVAVPGAVAGLCQMLAASGTLPLHTILSPAIEFARDGVFLTPEQGYITNLLISIFTDTPSISAIYVPNGRFIQAGDRLYFSDLARTLEALAEQGPDLFYTGDIAQQIVKDQQQNGGLVTETDLATYQVWSSEPLKINYRDYTILLPPLASDGGPLIAFALELLADCSLPEMSHNSEQHIQILAEVMRLTNVARAEWLQSENGLGPEQAAQANRRADTLLNARQITHYRQRLQATLAGQMATPDVKLPTGPSSTTHISVADEQGRVVSLTVSSGESAGYVVGDTGVVLNNMLGEMDLHPNGFHKLPPGQRLSTMMSPAIVLHQDEPLMGLGSGGSNRLRSAILQTISNFVDFNNPLDRAVSAPRIHFEENVLQLEGGIEAKVADHLETTGYDVNRWPERNMFFGGAHVVAKQDGAWQAVGDARRGGASSVV